MLSVVHRGYLEHHPDPPEAVLMARGKRRRWAGQESQLSEPAGQHDRAKPQT